VRRRRERDPGWRSAGPARSRAAESPLEADPQEGFGGAPTVRRGARPGVERSDSWRIGAWRARAAAQRRAISDAFDASYATAGTLSARPAKARGMAAASSSVHADWP